MTTQYPRQGSSTSFKKRPLQRASLRLSPLSRTPTNFKWTRKKCAHRITAVESFPGKLSKKQPFRTLPARTRLHVQEMAAWSSSAKHPVDEGTTTEGNRDNVPFHSITVGRGQVTRRKKEGMSKTAPPKVDTQKTLLSRRTGPAEVVSEQPVKSITTPPYFPLPPYVDAGTASSTIRALPLSTIQGDLRGTANVGSGATKRKNSIWISPKHAEQPEDSFDKKMGVKIDLGRRVQNFRLSSAAQDSEQRHSQEMSPIYLMNPRSVPLSVINTNEEYTSATSTRKIDEGAPEKTSMSPEPTQPTTWQTLRLPEKLTVLSTFRSQRKISLTIADKMSSAAPDSISGKAAVATIITKISSSVPDHVFPAFPVSLALASSTVTAKGSEAVLQVTPPDPPSFTYADDLRIKSTSSWAEERTHAMLPPSTERIISAGSYPGLAATNEADFEHAYATIGEQGVTSPTKQALAGAHLSIRQTEIATEPSHVLSSPRKLFTSFISTDASALPIEATSSFAGSYTRATVVPFTEKIGSPASHTDLAARSEAGLASTYMKIRDHGATSPPQQRLKETDLSFTQAGTAKVASPVLTYVSKAFPSSTEASDSGYKQTSSWTHATVAYFTEEVTSPSSYTDLAARNEVSLFPTYTTIRGNEATPPTKQRLKEGTKTATAAAPVLTSASEAFTSSISTLPQSEALWTADVYDSMEEDPRLPGSAHPKEEEREWEAKRTDATASDTRSTAHVNDRHSEVRRLISPIISTLKPAVYSTMDRSSLPNTADRSVKNLCSEQNQADVTHFTTPMYDQVTKQFLNVKARDIASEATQKTILLDGRLSTHILRVGGPERARNNNNSWPDVNETFPLPENQSEDFSLYTPSNDKVLTNVAGFQSHGMNTAELLSTATSPDTLLPSHTKRTHSPGADFDQYIKVNGSNDATSSEFAARIPEKISNSNDSSSFIASHFSSSNESPSYIFSNFTGVSAPSATSMTTETEVLHGSITELQNDNASLRREGITRDGDLSLNHQPLELHLSKSFGRSLVKNPLLAMHLSTLSSPQATAATHSEMHPSNESSNEHTTTSSAPKHILSQRPSASVPDETRSFTRPSLSGGTENVASTDAIRWFGTPLDGGAYSSGDGETSSSKVTDAVLLLATQRLKQPRGNEAEGTRKNISTTVISEDSPRVNFNALSTMEFKGNSQWPHTERASNLTDRNAVLVPTHIKLKEDVSIATKVSYSTPSVTSGSTAAFRRIWPPPFTSAKTGPSMSNPKIEAEAITKAPVCKSTFGLFRHPENCNLFVHCSNFVPYVKKCPANLHFNEKYMVCDYPYRARCLSNPS